MSELRQGRCSFRCAFWGLLAAFTLFRLILAGRYGLGTDESHYVLYARQLAWGYLDHPPMVGFLGAATGLIGETPFLVRLGPIACWTLSVVLLRWLVLALYRDERPALLAFLLLLLMPAQHLLALALLPDATLNVFWCGALLAGWVAFRDGRWRFWLLSGGLFGGAMLSKYHGVLLPLCILGYMLGSRETRRWFLSPKPYAAGLVGLLVFSPNILWNARHDWVSYAYQLGHGGGSGALSFAKLAESLGGQLAAATPVLFVLLIVAAVASWRDRPVNDADRYVFWTSIPVFVFFCGIGTFGTILPHWTAVGWWSGSVLVARVAGRRLARGGRSAARWRGWLGAGAALAVVLLVTMYAAIAFPIIGTGHAKVRELALALNRRFPSIRPPAPLEEGHDITNDLYGWEVAAREVERIRHSMPHPERTFVFCHLFYTTSQLAVYLEPGTAATALSPRRSQYELWFDPSRHEGWDALFVDDDRYLKGGARYVPLFEQGDAQAVEISVLRRGKVARRLHVYKLFGFRGAKERKRE